VAEFLPKTIFKLNPNALLKVFAVPLLLIYYVLYPVTILTTCLSRGVLRLSGLKRQQDSGHTQLTKVDIDFFIQQSIDDASAVEPTEPEVIMFQNALDFSSLKARDVMVPRTELIAVSIDAPLSELMNLFIETGFSKIPVFKGNIDNVVGYVHSSEMFKRPADWTSKITQIPVVPETKPVNKLMKQLLEKKRSIAVVIDEFGGTAGIITMEDLFEEIFGDFEDEHDNKHYIARQVGEGEYEFSGRLEIEKINEQFGLEIPESDEYVTLAGFILHYYQTFPKLHDVLTIGNFEIKIMKISPAKIELVRMKCI
jgi:CBS domain containing-hemolysin-like protein